MLPQLHAGKIIPKIGVVMHDWKVLLFSSNIQTQINTVANTLLFHVDLT